MKKITRRRLLWLGGTAALGTAALGVVRFCGPGWFGANDPIVRGRLQIFVDRCFGAIDRSRMWDGHVHLIGVGAGGSGCRLNPEMRDPLNVVRRFQYELFREATGMRGLETADQDYVDRLLAVQRAANPLGKLVVMAFDGYVDEDGVEHLERSAFYTPNAWALTVARRNPDLCVPCASIHPYRLDAVDRLDRALAGGARAVKWLPNSMGMDPASPRCDPFYRRMAEAGIPLISHAGAELAVEGAHDQELGNPLRLRRALDHGVTVIVAHAASFGTALDLDRGPLTTVHKPTFELFVRMMERSEYDDRLYADLSAITVANRPPHVLRRLLEATDWHRRYVHASDYPVPAIHIAIPTPLLDLADLISDDDRNECERLARVNPLLYDFCVKRCLRYRDPDGREYRFSNDAFENAGLFGG